MGDFVHKMGAYPTHQSCSGEVAAALSGLLRFNSAAHHSSRGGGANTCHSFLQTFGWLQRQISTRAHRPEPLQSVCDAAKETRVSRECVGLVLIHEEKKKIKTKCQDPFLIIKDLYGHDAQLRVYRNLYGCFCVVLSDCVSCGISLISLKS